MSELLAGMPLLFQPGSEWNYSMSTDVLGRVVEVLSGLPLDQALDELVLRPLGMDETWFAVPEDARDRFAALYVPTPGPGLARQDAVGASFLEPRWFSGGGGLSSTLGDYVRFTRFLARGGELDGVRLLGDRTVRMMAANHLPDGQDLRHFGRPLFAESPFDGVGFGLGFSVVLDPVATRTAGSVGEFAWGGAASTAFWVDPVEDLTAVFMTQLLPSSTYPAALAAAPARVLRAGRPPLRAHSRYRRRHERAEGGAGDRRIGRDRREHGDAAAAGGFHRVRRGATGRCHASSSPTPACRPSPWTSPTTPR